MKIKSLLIGMLACSAMVACTNEDLLENEENPALNGEKAYLAVRLVNSDATTSRATAGEEPFWYGTTAENEVATTHFYFFKDGVAYDVDSDNEISKILSWNTNGTDAAGQNVEKVAEALIVLEGLKNNTTPTEIVAVLNKPASMTLAGKSLTKLQEELSTSIYNETNNFIMTNSTYKGDDVVNTFATKITSANFIEDKPDATLAADKVVNIYVERLAAKVKVAVDADNDDLADTDEISLGEYTIKTGTNAQVTKELKIKIVGWGLNATTKNSYLVKSIDATNWADKKFTAFNWNDANNHRSYWAKSTNYGVTTAKYPASFSDAINEKGSNVVTGTDKTDANTATLNYVSWNELTQDLSKSLYCMENTNTAEILAPKYYSAATQAVVAAQIVDGEDLIRYNKTLYTADGFMARVLNELNLNIYKKVDNTTKQLSSEDLKVKNIYDGKVTIEAVNPSEVWYTDSQATTQATTGLLADRINALGVEAEYYNEGMMHYVIPIEHLAGGKFAFVNNQPTLNEADYGVVRNHFYNVTINKIENLGTSVYDPNEDIIKPTIDNTLYFIGASINILSWKIVSQGVDL